MISQETKPMTSSLVTAAGTFDLAEIMRTVWAELRASARGVSISRGRLFHRLANVLTRVWAEARRQRDAFFRGLRMAAEASARAAREAAMPAALRTRIETLRAERAIVQCWDSWSCVVRRTHEIDAEIARLAA